MGNCITEADVRAEGVTSATSARINSRIAKWEDIVEKITGNCFRVLDPGELTFDGNNTSTLYFNIPIISLTSIEINGDTAPLADTEYVIHSSRTPIIDDRHNPRIELCMEYDIFRTHSGIFARGYDQSITATWGYVDDDGIGGYVTPAPIKDCLVQLVILDLDSYSARGGTSWMNVSSETTDGHSISYGNSKSIWSMIPQQIADILMMYRRPSIISCPDVSMYMDMRYCIACW